MKRTILLAAMMVAALVARAQSCDTIAASLARTNAEMVRWQSGVTTHAAMVGIGGAAMLCGSLMTASAFSADTPDGWQQSIGRARVGAFLMVAGSASVALSFIPLPKGTHLDQRGLVVDLPQGKRRR